VRKGGEEERRGREHWRAVKRLRVDDGLGQDEGTESARHVATRYEELSGRGKRKRFRSTGGREELCLCGAEEGSPERDLSSLGNERGGLGGSEVLGHGEGTESLIDEADRESADAARIFSIDVERLTENLDTPASQTPEGSCTLNADTAASVDAERHIAQLDGAESDDTEYLHAFITRSKVKKAARIMLSPQKQIQADNQNAAVSSPRTRSRTALATLDRNSPSPKKSRKLEMKAKNPGHEDTVLSDVRASSPPRKRTRTRLPRPQRDQPATPSTIPFRRSNGTEFIFLQKTEAQQVAIATRSNTRRNKGKALQPRMKLESMSLQVGPSPAKPIKTRKNSKQVSWDEGLAYFAADQDLDPMEQVEEQQPQKTPVKRSRRLAPVRGTPAPKKQMAEATLDIPSSIGTPIAKTRTRTRGKT
jgi:hypothetical protein